MMLFLVAFFSLSGVLYHAFFFFWHLIYLLISACVLEITNCNLNKDGIYFQLPSGEILNYSRALR